MLSSRKLTLQKATRLDRRTEQKERQGEQIVHLVVFPAVVDAAGEDEVEETVGQQARK